MLREPYFEKHMTHIPFHVNIGNANMYVYVPVTDDELKTLINIAKKIDVNGEEIEPFLQQCSP